jgi:hypothetical protein
VLALGFAAGSVRRALVLALLLLLKLVLVRMDDSYPEDP